MAATLLRDAYDCIVLGSGRTASQVAAAIARTGRQTLQLKRETDAFANWLQPRFGLSAEFDPDQRLPLSSVCAVNAVGKPIASVMPATSWSAQRSFCSSTPSEITTFVMPTGCRAACETFGAVCLNGTMPPTVIHANAVVKIDTPTISTPLSVIGGLYRDVASDTGAERQATLFATRRGGEAFWLVPLAGGIWSLGLLQPQTRFPLAEEAIAHWLEEALVACPALTQRLIAAELVGGLHFTEPRQPAQPESLPGAIALPAYDQWLDPVFASGDWLGHELAQQFVPLLLNANFERIAEWLASWPAMEQLTRERIAPWYQLDSTLPAALHDHAQREWYEKLLNAQ